MGYAATYNRVAVCGSHQHDHVQGGEHDHKICTEKEKQRPLLQGSCHRRLLQAVAPDPRDA